MSNFLKPMGYLAMVAASVGGAGYSPEVNSQGVNVTATVKDGQSVQLLRPPLKIPMPLDKAGYTIDVMFEVPSSMLLKGMTYVAHYFIGLQVLYTPGTSDVYDALKAHPVTVRLSLFRLENGKDIRIPLFSRTTRASPGEPPRKGAVSELVNGEAIASHYYTQGSRAPRGTPNAAALGWTFASPDTAITPGIYRFQVETLEDIPALKGIPAFFVYEELHER